MIGTLKQDAARRALASRLRFKYSLDGPCDVYEMICKYGLSLRFTNTGSLAGMYLSDGLAGSINVSALRPSGYQRFTAAHELGHFLLDHGTQLDGKIEDMESSSKDENAADTYSRHLLMPKRAVFHGFRALGATPTEASPVQYYKVASWLGVGYTTLAQHIRWTLGSITTAKLHEIDRHQPQSLKRGLVPSVHWIGRKELWPLEPWWHESNLHVQVGDVVTGLKWPDPEYFDIGDSCAVASKIGQFQAHIYGGGAVMINICKNDYCGMYQYRYLGEPPDA